MPGAVGVTEWMFGIPVSAGPFASAAASTFTFARLVGMGAGAGAWYPIWGCPGCGCGFCP